jgi:glycine/D-amino acid oxidase-like deaminating enzyme
METAALRTSYDIIVAGAGMVGSAIAYGLAGHGLRVLALDGADGDARAAKANFGLIWVQGKGYGKPAYQRLSRASAALWPAFADALTRETGVRLDYRANGGLHFCLGDTQFNERTARMKTWQTQAPEAVPCVEMLDRDAVEKLLPGVRLGPEVSGASLGKQDADVNPLRLLAALQRGLIARGGVLRGGSAVTAITARTGGGFLVDAGGCRYEAPRVVIAAGLGSAALGAQVGLHAPLRPQRGQVLITERLAPLLALPCSGIRQTAEGSVMIGLTQEEVGHDRGTTTTAAVQMTRKAIRVLPALAQARLVRQWACLRIMTPDGTPVYAESSTHAGAWIALCHSGVTLAAYHAGPFSAALAGGALPPNLDCFHHDRFLVPQAA